jgi:hypothetical protein
MGTPTFEKKHFLLQSSDIPKRIWKVVGGGDLSDSSPEKHEPFFLKEGHSENILDPNEDWDRRIILSPKIFPPSNPRHCMPRAEAWALSV